MKRNFSRKNLVACAIMAICAALAEDAVVFGQDSKPQNVFVSSPVLPKDLKRVLVLPLVWRGIARRFVQRL